MANPGTRVDALPAFHFEVDIGGTSYPFRSCTGLSSETKVYEVEEGGVNTHVHKLVGPTSFPNLVLRQGFCNPSSPLYALYQNFASSESAKKRFDGFVRQIGPERHVGEVGLQAGLDHEVVGARARCHEERGLDRVHRDRARGAAARRSDGHCRRRRDRWRGHARRDGRHGCEERGHGLDQRGDNRRREVGHRAWGPPSLSCRPRPRPPRAPRPRQARPQRPRLNQMAGGDDPSSTGTSNA